MTVEDGTWHFGIGDPTPFGWFTVVAYFGAAFCCWIAMRFSASAPNRDHTALFWLLLAAALVGLGVNKQLDLQTALTEFGRMLARSEGWYERRQRLQIYFIVAVGVSGVIALSAFAWLSIPLSLGRSLALAGTVLLVAFVLVRAASFHHLDAILGQSALGLRWNWILELTGIGLVGAGAAVEIGKTRASLRPGADERRRTGSVR